MNEWINFEHYFWNFEIVPRPHVRPTVYVYTLCIYVHMYVYECILSFIICILSRMSSHIPKSTSFIDSGVRKPGQSTGVVFVFRKTTKKPDFGNKERAKSLRLSDRRIDLKPTCQTHNLLCIIKLISSKFNVFFCI